jgi:hypothetical protein
MKHNGIVLSWCERRWEVRGVMKENDGEEESN